MSIPTVSTEHPAQTEWERLAQAGRYPDAVVEYLRRHDYVTFAEIQLRLAPFLETRGAVCLEQASNLVLWADMSQELADLLQGLLRARRVFLHPASALTYLIDGGLLKLPLARRPPAGGYKEQHWLPTTLRLIPLRDRGRTGRRTSAVR